MRKLISLLLLFTSGLVLQACDPVFLSFCSVAEEAYPEEPIFLARVIDSNEMFREVELIEVLRGNEERPTIRVWNSDTLFCNGPFTQLAAEYGEVGDTVLGLFKLKKELDGSDVPLGDYYKPSVLSGLVALPVKNDSIKGLILDEQTYSELKLSEFLQTNSEEWSACQNIEHAINGMDEKGINIYPNPMKNKLFIELTGESHSPRKSPELNLFSINGNLLINSSNVNGYLDVSNLLPGIYFLEINTENNKIIKRIIKNL